MNNKSQLFYVLQFYIKEIELAVKLEVKLLKIDKSFKKSSRYAKEREKGHLVWIRGKRRGEIYRK